jgi:opacity protein-like surface antigen
MKKLFLLSAACLAVVAPKAADAFLADLNPLGNAGYYASINAGPNWVNFQRTHERCGSGDFSGSGRRHHKNNNNVGYYVAGTLGLRTCFGLRFEGEVAYRNNQRNEHRRNYSGDDFSGSGRRHHRHNLSNTAIMFNGLYDLDLCWAIKPYGGFGIGYAWAQTPRRHWNNSGHHHKRDRNGFAWQGIAGLAYPLDFLCSCGYTVDATVEYRYFKPQARRVNHNTLSFGLRTNF